MKIYTKKGDAGETSLFGGMRVPKDHLRIQAYGTLDELNSALGLVLAEGEKNLAELAPRLLRLQGELFQLGAELATPAGRALTTKAVGAVEIGRMEQEIDEMEAKLKPLTSFILPGGSPESALLHVARTVSRRAERELVAANRNDPQRPEALQYVNRLADYLFVAARFANHLRGVGDIPWTAP